VYLWSRCQAGDTAVTKADRFPARNSATTAHTIATANVRFHPEVSGRADGHQLISSITTEIRIIEGSREFNAKGVR
jgi:hypothetical protein